MVHVLQTTQNFCHFTLLFCRGRQKKCTQNYNARAQPLFSSLNLLFSGVAVAVAVVVFLSSLNKKVKQRRQWRQGRCWVKNEFIFYQRNWQLSRSVQYPNGSKNMLRLNIQWQRSIPNGNTKNSPSSFAFLRRHRPWSFHVLAFQRSAKIYNVLAELLLCSLNLFFWWRSGCRCRRGLLKLKVSREYKFPFWSTLSSTSPWSLSFLYSPFSSLSKLHETESTTQR